LEYGYNPDAETVEELVVGYSYSDQWAAELSRRVDSEGLAGLNMFVFLEVEQLDQPCSVKGIGYTLRYMGTIEYRI
jgi:hypothetical protein